MDRMRNLLKPSGSRSRLRDAGQESEDRAAVAPPAPLPPQSPPATAALDEDEQIQLALAISAAEQAGAAGSGAPRAAARPRTAPPRRHLEPTDSDEALARHLQEQLNLEAAAAAAASAGPRGPVSGFLPPPDMPLAPPHLPAAPLPSPSAPRWQQGPPDTPWQPVPRPTHLPAGPWADMRPPAPAVPANPNVCGGCGKPVGMWPTFATALGRRWHPACLRCAHCQAPIQVRAVTAAHR